MSNSEIDIKSRLMECLTRNGIELLSDPPEYDSVSFITAVVDIENEFGFTFPDELLNIESFNNIDILLDFVKLQISTERNE